MEKTVIFLGAGASKADGAPLQRELFRSYFESFDEEKTQEHNIRKQSNVRERVDSYFKHFYEFSTDFNYKDVVFPTFEEALGILDLAIERNEKYKSELGNLYEYRTALIYAMAQAIQYKIDNVNINVQGESHTKLIDNIYKNILDGDIIFISTNYDILIDNILGSKFKTIDYGFYHGEEDYNGSGEVKLLKIHGSLNWKYCPVCKHIEAKTGEKVMLEIVDNPGSVKCGCCGSEAQYVIVPPTYFKDMSNIYLSNIWNNAERALREAEHIVLCGYSLPSADMHVKYLLKRAELNGIKKSPFRLTVINHYRDKIHGAVEKERNRYNRLFKKTSCINYMEDMSFQQFAEKPFKVLF